MMEAAVSIILALGLSVITVLADFFVKKSSLQQSFSGWPLLVLGAAIYGLTALGWFFVLRYMKLSTAGVIYGVSCILLLVFLSVFYFNEKISLIEMTGITMGIISVILLARFA